VPHIQTTSASSIAARPLRFVRAAVLAPTEISSCWGHCDMKSIDRHLIKRFRYAKQSTCYDQSDHKLPHVGLLWLPTLGPHVRLAHYGATEVRAGRPSRTWICKRAIMLQLMRPAWHRRVRRPADRDGWMKAAGAFSGMPRELRASNSCHSIYCNDRKQSNTTHKNARSCLQSA
jgi:hypothetical protein